MKIFAVIAVMMVTATGQFVKMMAVLLVMGILKEVAEGKQYIGIGYILNKNIRQGWDAGEGTAACVNMLFVNQLQTLYGAGQTNNFASQRHCRSRPGMKAMCNFGENYRGQEMPIFFIRWIVIMAEDSIERNCNVGTGSKKIFTIITAGTKTRKCWIVI